MSNITGSSSATLGSVTLARVTAAEAYLGIAEQFMSGARALALTPGCALAFTYLCGHVSECLLKAFLSWKGVSEADLKMQNTRHNLNGLWEMAVARGLAVDPTEPQWLATLSSLHDGPFRLRYPVGLNGLVTPGPIPMLSDLETLLELARGARP